MDYSVWLEFEQYAENSLNDVSDGFCNAAVTFADGRHVGFNVWTIDYFSDQVDSIVAKVAGEGFAISPDLVVARLDRENIVYALAQVIVE